MIIFQKHLFLGYSIVQILVCLPFSIGNCMSLILTAVEFIMFFIMRNPFTIYKSNLSKWATIDHKKQ